MKRSVIATVLGLSVVGATATAFGQGGIVIGNYQGAYNQVLWGAGSARAGQGVLSAEGVSLSLWFGEGALSDGELNSNMPLPWHSTAEGNGYLGYYQFVSVVLPDWTPGDIYSFQVRASGPGVVELASRSTIWTEQSAIQFVGGEPAGLPGESTQSIGLVVVVPEPSTFALMGLGAAGLMLFRRRT